MPRQNTTLRVVNSLVETGLFMHRLRDAVEVELTDAWAAWNYIRNVSKRPMPALEPFLVKHLGPLECYAGQFKERIPTLRELVERHLKEQVSILNKPLPENSGWHKVYNEMLDRAAKCEWDWITGEGFDE